MTAQPMPFELKANIAAAFGESDLPFKVDIVDWADTSVSFRDIIDECKVLLLRGVGNTSKI